MFKVSLMESNSKSNAIEVTSWHELAEIVGKNNWSQGVFKNDHRLAENFISAEVIALDIDGGHPLKDALSSFSKYQHIIVPSKSHQIEKNGIICDRYRVVLKLSETITDKDVYANTWKKLFEMFPFIDKAAKDCSRFYYKCPHQTASVSDSGLTITPVKSGAPVTRYKPPMASQPITRGKLSNKSCNFLLNGAEPGEWNDTLYKVAKDAQAQGWTIEELTEKVDGINHHLDPSDISTIKSAYKNAPTSASNVDYNEGLRNLIFSSKLIVNRENAHDSFLVNPVTGQTLKIDLKNIRSVLRGEFDPYIRTEKIIASILYEPHRHAFLWSESNGLYSYNSYQPPLWKKDLFLDGKLEAKDSLPEIYQLFLNQLLANHEESFEYLLDWLALSLQGRNMTILTAIGEEGIGKGILGEIMEDLHGKGNFIKVRDTVFKEKFNAPFENRTLVYVDEIKITDRTSLDRIKDVVNWQIEIEKKGIDPKSVKNHASFYLSSNSFDAIPIDAGQRRFSIIQLTDTKLKDSELGQNWPNIQLLVDELRSSENIALLAMYLLNRKVDQKRMLEPFISERADDVKEAGLKDWEIWVVNSWCKYHINPYKQVPLSELQTDIKDTFHLKNAPGRRLLEDLAKKYPDAFRVKKVGSSRMISFPTPSSEIKMNSAITPQKEAELEELERQLLS